MKYKTNYTSGKASAISIGILVGTVTMVIWFRFADEIFTHGCMTFFSVLFWMFHLKSVHKILNKCEAFFVSVL